MLKSYWDDLPSRSLLGWRLPLQRHEGLMTDSRFQNVRSHFDQTFKNTMSSWNNREEDDFASYRKLRDRQLTGKDRLSSIVEEGNNYKIVMDVHGFVDNDLKVTFINETELIVEGLIEKKSEGSFTRQSFKRRFSFPGKVIVNSAYSTLSSDNILTVTVSKQLQQIVNEEKKMSSPEKESSISGRTEKKDIKEAFIPLHQNIESKLGSLMEFPITKRNDFFADSYFVNVRNMFKSRVSEIMNRSAMRDSFDDFSSFRSFRDKDEQNIAMTVTGDTKEHMIVLDVHGFNEGDLKVRAVSDQELLVEGNVEKKSENSYCNNSFKRSFCLPSNVNIQDVSSNLSSDGVLTIFVPKRAEKPLPIMYNVPIDMEKKMQQLLEKTSDTKSIPVVIPLGYLDTSLAAGDAKSSNMECVIPVQMEGNPVPTSSSQNITSACQAQEITCNSKAVEKDIQFIQDNLLKSSVGKEQATDECSIPVLMEDRPTNTVPISIISDNIQKTIDETKSESISQSIQMKGLIGENVSHGDFANKTSSQITEQMSDISSLADIHSTQLFTPRVVPMNLRGEFYNDSVFDGARQQIESALKNAMNRSLSQEGNEIQMPNIKKETVETPKSTGTSTILDEIHSYKIVLDVFGFPEKDIIVRTVSKIELSVEGSMNEQKGNSITKHSFQRTFQLPDNIKIEESTSALSSDGMLTITIPKKVPTDQEVLLTTSKTLTAESIEAQLSDLTKQMDQISNITDAAAQQRSRKEFIVPLNLRTSSDSGEFNRNNQRMQSSSSEQSQGEKMQKHTNILLAMDDKTQREDSFNKNIEVKSYYDLPVTKRGNFFQDSFFNDSRETYEVALKNAMGRFKSFSSFSDDLDFYKKLREEKFGGENLATEISEDQQFKKVVVDVKGYPQDCISVKVIEGNGILVEGKMKEKMDAGFSTKSFRRIFYLPPNYNLKDAISAMSIDGILNIKVPKTNNQS